MASPVRHIACIAVVSALAGALLASAGGAQAATPPAPPPAAAPTAYDSLLAAPAITPDLLERAALARNPTLAAASAAAAEAKARADGAGRFMNPMIEAMAAPQAIGNEDIAAPGYEVGLEQHVALFGQRGQQKNAAHAEARAAGEDLRAARLDLLQGARRLYYEYFLVERGIEVNGQLKSLLEHIRSLAVQKYASGAVGQQDALQAEVELAMLDHESIVLARERRIVRARLNAMLHRGPVDDLPAPLDSIPDAVEGEESPAAADAPLLRPDVRRAEAERDARAAELSLARKQRLPDITLLARYDAMWAEHEMRPTIGAELSLPIGFGRIGAGEREAEAGLARREQERLATIDRARLEIEEARARVQETRHEIHVMATAVLPATERALTSIRTAYESNRSDFLTLLNAERDLARARLGWHRARVEYRMALADYERAVARDAAPLGEEQR
jgi:outer membrane protein, heavy metal efflux system